MPDTEGTHAGRRRPADGWPNVKAPEEHPGRKIRKARERLKARIENFDASMKTMKMGTSGYKRPGSLKCR